MLSTAVGTASITSEIRNVILEFTREREREREGGREEPLDINRRQVFSRAKGTSGKNFPSLFPSPRSADIKRNSSFCLLAGKKNYLLEVFPSSPHPRLKYRGSPSVGMR